MSDVKWIKLSTGIFKDEKITLMEAMPERDTLFYIWIRLLVLAGVCNDGGAIYLSENIPYTDEMLSTLFNRPLNVVRLALDTFQKLEMIEAGEDQRIVLVNWYKHQNEDALTTIREKTRKRVAAFRERKRLEENRVEGNVTETNVTPGHKHGINKKVLLTDANYSELCERYGKELADEYIQKVDDYCANHGKTYANYVNAVHTYIRNDVKRGKLVLDASMEKPKCPECGGDMLGKGSPVCIKCGWSKSRPGKIE